MKNHWLNVSKSKQVESAKSLEFLAPTNPVVFHPRQDISNAICLLRTKWRRKCYQLLPEAESTGLKHELVRLSTNAEPPRLLHYSTRKLPCIKLIWPFAQTIAHDWFTTPLKTNYLKPVGTKGTLQPAPALETELYILVCFNASANYCTEAKPQERLCKNISTVVDVPKRPARPQQHQ